MMSAEGSLVPALGSYAVADYPADRWTDTRTDGERPFLARALVVAKRRKWIILGSIFLALMAGLIVTLMMTPKYTAYLTLEIQRESANITDVEGVEPQTPLVDQEFYATQYGLLQSRSLAERVAADLGLMDNPAFFEMYDVEVSEWFDGARVLPNASTRDERLRVAGDVLLANLAVSPGRLSRLVELQFTSPDQEVAQNVANSWAENFISQTLERRFEATSYAREFLEGRLEELRERIDQAERRLVTYAEQQGIVNIPAPETALGEAGGGERSLASDDLASLNRELTQATADRIRAESRVNSRPGQVSEALQNPAIASLRQRRAEIAAEYARLMTQFEPGYPPAAALQSQVDRLDQSIAAEEARVINSLRGDFQASVAREQSLEQNVQALQDDVLDMRRRSIQYNIFQREADTERQLYDALLQRYKAIGVAGGVGTNNVSVVDLAQLPGRPSSPQLLLNLALSFLAGLVIGAVIAFLLEQFDQGISDPEEVENMLRAPMLGAIPKLPDEDDAQEALEDRKSLISEAYISLQTRLAFSSSEGVPRSIAITSSRPAEGKTTTSYALALSLVRTKRRVLLIDADMRSPSIHTILGTTNDAGLSNVLSGQDLQSQIKQTQHEGLFVLTAGPQPPSAPELLSNDRLKEVLNEALGTFDHVIVDAPPVMGLADASLIGSRVAGVVFVVESHNTNGRMARAALTRIRSSNSHLLGVVLTKLDIKRTQDGYGYGYGYGYGSDHVYGDTSTPSSARAKAES